MPDLTEKKERLYEELKLKLALGLDGVYFAPEIIDELFELLPNNNVVQTKITRDVVERLNYNVPLYFALPFGTRVFTRGNRDSLYSIEKEGDVYYAARRGVKLAQISFVDDSPAFYGKTASGGTPMREIAMQSSWGSPHKSFTICYSEECSAKEKGDTCLFCSFNRPRRKEFELEAPPFKSPKQIGETAAAAYAEGFSHLTITGGFIPERREVDYYLDVAESLQQYIGVTDFNGTACIGAPLDLSIIDKYKEAGFRTIGLNTEVWGKEWFDVICPAKVAVCGGYDNWIKTTEYAVQVFGKGKVRANFVVGLQPKERLLEGIEYLASIGVVTMPSPWVPSYGSPLEDHRTPTVDWHWDIQLKIYNILRKYGRTFNEIFDASPARFLTHDFYEIDDGTLPVFKTAS
ncbi:MAG: radical SAM protein [Clostridiales bacterium]|nr:radical SAM protein [Clostridiales bacterium]